MSQENLEAFKRGTEAYPRRDAQALVEELDPAIEWYPGLEVMLGGDAAVYRGHEGVFAMLRETDEALAEIQAEYSEVRDVGDRIVALGPVRTRGKASGAAAESPLGVVADLMNGKVIRIRTYLDPEKALKAAGLSEKRQLSARRSAGSTRYS